MMRRAAAAVMAVLLIAGCAASVDEPDVAGSPSGSPSTAVSPFPTAGGNGSLFTVRWNSEVTVESHPISADGSVGAAVPILSEPGDEQTFPALLDSLAELALTGTFQDYWTTDLQVRAGGEVVTEVAAPRWCAGEGLSYATCVLLDATRLARTTELGRDPMTGEGPDEGSILVSSLSDGETLAEYGPIEDLSTILGTASPDELILVTTPPGDGDQARASTVLRMDLTDGTTTQMGTSPRGWGPLCPIGADSVLGYTITDTSDGQAIDTLSTTSVVGSATVAEVTWSVQDDVGCSADGRYLYLNRATAPPTGENDNEPPNPPTTVERIDLTSGARDSVLVLDPGVSLALVGR